MAVDETTITTSIDIDKGKLNKRPVGSHKFVWSVPCNSYTLAAVCEYCGTVAFYSNRSTEIRDIPETCKNNPVEADK